MTAVLVYPLDRNGAIRMVETPLSYTQSTCSPRVIHFQSTFSHFQSTFSHMWIHIQSTWGSTYVVPYARGHRGIYGVQRRMVEAM